MSFLRLVVRNLLRHPLRSFLTIGSLVVAVFLLCTLRSLVTTLDAGLESKSSRLIVQSAVSLYVDLPLSYQAEIEAVPGVASTCKWQWFGGYYQDPGNQFGQFATDADTLFEIYPELEIVDGSAEAWAANRRGCIVGEGLVESFGWKVGDTVPLIGALFPHPDGPNEPWEFQLEAVYRPSIRNFDKRTLFFHWDYFEKTLENPETGTPGMGTVVILPKPGVDRTQLIAAVDALYENGPQRVQTTTEDEFNAQFISMIGNVPFFVAWIGGAVLVAILLACVNTMLMAAREQTHDVGILKALGFTDARMFALLSVQSLVLCGLGGGIGLALALASESSIAGAIEAFFPGYGIADETVQLGVFVTLAIGLIAGLVPGWQASRMRTVEALSATR